MKQPELGKRIAQIRKQMNLTQEELEERCHVSVRTIQRIEAGDVVPRPSTIRILMAALDHDLSEVMENELNTGRSWWQRVLLIGSDSGRSPETKTILQTAWIAGIIYFVLGLIEAAMEYVHLTGLMNVSQKLFYVSVKLAVFVCYGLFMRGIVMIGLLFDNYLLRVSGYLLVATFLIITGIDVFEAFQPFEEELYLFIHGGISITVGGLGIVLGLAFWRLQRHVGRLAELAGVFELLIGACFLTVVLFFLSLLMMVPATIIEIVLLFKVYEMMGSSERPNGVYA